MLGRRHGGQASLPGRRAEDFGRPDPIAGVCRTSSAFLRSVVQ